MANVTVTILQSGRCDEWGRPYVVDNSYSVGFNEARSLWQTGFASVEDPAIFDDDSTYKTITGIVKYFGFVGFRKCLLASLVANSTASRTNGLVTVTATSHGIPTGATYQGYRFFYPGSPSLAAGWYDSIYAIATANTLSFTAPGPDFASESVNGAAAYTTQTLVPGSAIIPGYSLDDVSRARLTAATGGGTTAATKTFKFHVNESPLTGFGATSSPFGIKEVDLISTGPTSVGMSITNAWLNTIVSATVDKALDIKASIALTVSAAADFAVLFPTPGVILLA